MSEPGIDELGRFDHFEHPVQMILAADRIVWVDEGCGGWVRCPHYGMARLLWREPTEPRAAETVTYDIAAVRLHWYAFPFPTLGWEIAVRMNLCECGTLYILDDRVRYDWIPLGERHLYTGEFRWGARYKGEMR